MSGHSLDSNQPHLVVGVISDTHGFFEPAILDYFKGASHILHAGDVGEMSILRMLEQLAPVTAVRGNCDAFEVLPCPELAVIELGGRKFLIYHEVEPSGENNEIFEQRLRVESPDVVVFGHTHRRCERWIGRTLYLNPGYAGRKRGQQPRSIALLRLKPDGIETEFVDLG